MKNRNRFIVIFAAVALTAAALTGCGQARTETDHTTPSTQAVVQKDSEKLIIEVTEKSTETPQTQKKVQAVTEKVQDGTEKDEAVTGTAGKAAAADKQQETQAPQTEKQAVQTETQAPQTETQAPQTETQAPAAQMLSREEEEAAEEEYTDYKTMWAKDDINVRETPTTEEENIFYSLDQGQTAQIVGETPSWYLISIPYTDDAGETKYQKGYVSKQFMSESEVQPKTEEERSAAASAAETASDAASSGADTASAGAEADGQEDAAVSGPTVTMAADANIRQEANQTSDVVGVVAAGEKVTVIGDENGWYKVDYNGVQGYVNKNLVG